MAWGLAAITLLTVSYSAWLDVTNPTIIALSFLLVVLFVAAASTLRVALAISIVAFGCFNFFFLPPVGTFRIADPQNWVALFSLLAVSIVASHLSAQVRRRARETAALLEERKEAEVLRRGAELKSALLASLGHDLNTPLTAVTVAANNLNATWLTSAALAHVLENAAQYSPAGAAIDVRVTLASGELQIAVRDRGAGIAPQDLDRLFERFYRGAGAQRYRLGTGVGLAITSGLIAAEGGRVWVQNRAEGGAEFTIAVPAETRAAEVLEREAL